MKLCKDCIHFVMNKGGIEWYASHTCSDATSAAYQEPITGTIVPGSFMRCADRRREGRKCGPDANRFIAKDGK